MRVVVVGAGLAGLSAAEALLAAGFDVTVIEASRRIGGRTRTVTQSFVSEQYGESGAEWVDTIHWRMHDLMQRFGIETLGDAVPWTTIRRWVFWNGSRYSDAAIDSLEKNLFSSIDRYEALCDAPGNDMVDPSRPCDHPRAAQLDERSLAEVMVEADLGPVGQLLARRNAQGEFASEPAQVSCLFVAQQRAFERSETERQGIELLSTRVRGGVSQIAMGLGSEISAHPRLTLQMATELTSIEQTADGVVVGYRGIDGTGFIDAQEVVLACSLIPLRKVEFRDHLPDLWRQSVWGLGYGSITKTAVQFGERQWDTGYGTTDSLSQRLYDPSVAQSGQSGLVMSYCGGDGGRALAQYADDVRREKIIDDMRQVHAITAAVHGSFTRSWSNEPFFGGAYAIYEPGQVTKYWDVLRRPWGRVHLAGEHVATCTGYMEGAVESGRQVADDIVRSA